MNAHVQYAGEISPKKLRGFINVTSTVFLALGKTMARILGLRCLCSSFSACFMFIFLLYSRVFSQSWNQTYTRGGVLFCLTTAVKEEAPTPYKSLGFPCLFPGDRNAFLLGKDDSVSGGAVNMKRLYVNTLSKLVRSKSFANFSIISCRVVVLVQRAVVGIF